MSGFRTRLEVVKSTRMNGFGLNLASTVRNSVEFGFWVGFRGGSQESKTFVSFRAFPGEIWRKI